jgi:hypothetical protein
MMNKTTNYKEVVVGECDDGSGDLFLEFPPELMNDVGWSVGDDIKFLPQDNGSFLLKKVQYESVELELDDDTFIRVATMAHENNITFNEQVGIILEESLTEQPTQETDK